MNLDILAIAAHPDDVELSASGTILKSIAQGKKVGIIDITSGQLGSRGTPELRKKEAQKAAEILGLEARENLELQDGFFRNDKEHQYRIIEMIRKYRPKIVLTNASEDRHPDHGRAGNLVSEACFYSGLRALKTTLDHSDQEHWRPQAVYHFIQDRYLKPDFVMDISGFFQQKMEAVKAFSSQFFVNENSHEGPQTPISTPDFIKFLEARAREFGRLINVEYGEGFTVDRPVGVDNLDNLL